MKATFIDFISAFWRYILLLIIVALFFAGFDFELSSKPRFVIKNPLVFCGIILVVVGILFICIDVYRFSKDSK